MLSSGARAPAFFPWLLGSWGCIRVAGAALSPHNPNHRAFWHRIHLSPSLLPRRHVGDIAHIAATGSSMVERGPPHLVAASSTELSPTTSHQLHHTSCSPPNLHCSSRQQLARRCLQVDASCLLPCPVLPCNAQHTIAVATIRTHSHAFDHCLNKRPVMTSATHEA